MTMLFSSQTIAVLEVGGGELTISADDGQVKETGTVEVMETGTVKVEETEVVELMGIEAVEPNSINRKDDIEAEEQEAIHSNNQSVCTLLLSFNNFSARYKYQSTHFYNRKIGHHGCVLDGPQSGMMDVRDQSDGGHRRLS